ncbi:MAG: hypothetical protein ABMA64_28345 [Myxococcota bacterium]
MRNPMMVVMLSMSGCSSILGTSWEGIWFVQMPPMDAAACETVGDENFEDGEFPDLNPGGGGDWSITDEEEVSDYAFLAQVMKGKSGEVFVVIDDRVFPGVADGKTLTATWEGVTDDTHAEEHDAGYDYSDSFVAHTVETLSITRTKGEYVGTWEIESSSVVHWIETDQWKSAQVGLTSGQMPSDTFLIGTDTVNTAAGEECNGDCQLVLTTNCAGSVDFSARYAGHQDNGLFSGVGDAGQPAGAGTGGYYTDPYTYSSYYY